MTGMVSEGEDIAAAIEWPGARAIPSQSSRLFATRIDISKERAGELGSYLTIYLLR